MTEFQLPFTVRGRLIEGDEHLRTADGVVLRMPDPARALKVYLEEDGCRTEDLHRLSLMEIIDFLADLGRRLDPNTNPYMREAFKLSLRTSSLPEPVLRTIYTEQLSYFFRPDILLNAVDRRIGRHYLEGWVHETGPDGRRIRIRAYGARAVHVIAGNTPGVAGVTITRNALTRSDALIKTPSNDPLTAIALARTMIEMDPDHPLTRHISVMHWTGGDERIEAQIFSNSNIDKIIAWGGAGAIENAARYVGPGVELIALDPKRSMSLLGADALDGAQGTREAAHLLSRDLGLYNQEGCVNARVAYVETSGIADASRQLRLLGQAIYQALQDLPPDYSSPVDRLDARLSEELETASFMGEPEVIGTGDGRGGVILSSSAKPVDFAELLSGRYLNLVAVRDFSNVIDGITSTVQTVGVWPATLKESLAHPLALAGVQRIVSLGGATNPHGNQSIPQDGIEVLRRMCRWIVNEDESDELIASRPASLDAVTAAGEKGQCS